MWPDRIFAFVRWYIAGCLHKKSTMCRNKLSVALVKNSPLCVSLLQSKKSTVCRNKLERMRSCKVKTAYAAIWRIVLESLVLEHYCKKNVPEGDVLTKKLCGSAKTHLRDIMVVKELEKRVKWNVSIKAETKCKLIRMLKSFVLKKNKNTKKCREDGLLWCRGHKRVPHIYSGHGETLQWAESTTGMRCQNRCHGGLL